MTGDDETLYSTTYQTTLYSSIIHGLLLSLLAPPHSYVCLPTRRVELHQVSHLHPHSDRAAGLLEDTGLLRDEGAPRHHRARAVANLLVPLEEFQERGRCLHPATHQVDLFYAPPRRGEGPTMYWYGWTATSLLGAAVLGVLATFLPEHVTRKIPLALVWIVPVLVIPLLFYSLMPFWTR